MQHRGRHRHHPLARCGLILGRKRGELRLGARRLLPRFGCRLGAVELLGSFSLTRLVPFAAAAPDHERDRVAARGLVARRRGVLRRAARVCSARAPHRTRGSGLRCRRRAARWTIEGDESASRGGPLRCRALVRVGRGRRSARTARCTAGRAFSRRDSSSAGDSSRRVSRCTPRVTAAAPGSSYARTGRLAIAAAAHSTTSRSRGSAVSASPRAWADDANPPSRCSPRVSAHRRRRCRRIHSSPRARSAAASHQRQMHIEVTLQQPLAVLLAVVAAARTDRRRAAPPRERRCSTEGAVVTILAPRLPHHRHRAAPARARLPGARAPRRPATRLAQMAWCIGTI